MPTLTGGRLRELWYAPLLAVAMGLMLLRLLLMARWLEVTAFAAYSAALLVSSSFCMLVCLGLQPMLQRDLPVAIVRGRECRGAVLIAQCIIVAVACAGFGLALAAGGARAAGLSPALLAIGLVHGLSQQLFLVATVESRSRGEPLRFAWQNLGRALGVLAAGAFVAMATASAAGVLLIEAVLSIAMAAVLLRMQLRVYKLGAAQTLRLALRRLPCVRWRTAAALLAVSSIAFVLINIDRWVAAQALPPQRFAQYAFAWTALMVAQSLQVIVGSSLYPLLARRFAGVGGRAAFRISVRASLSLLCAAGLAALPLWWLLDHAIARWFAAYNDARALLPAFLLVAALRVSDFWSSFVLVAGRETRLLWFQLAVGAVALPAWWWLAQSLSIADDLLGVALLAVLLGVLGYLAAAWAAWGAARELGA